MEYIETGYFRRDFDEKRIFSKLVSYKDGKNIYIYKKGNVICKSSIEEFEQCRKQIENEICITKDKLSKLQTKKEMFLFLRDNAQYLYLETLRQCCNFIDKLSNEQIRQNVLSREQVYLTFNNLDMSDVNDLLIEYGEYYEEVKILNTTTEYNLKTQSSNFRVTPDYENPRCFNTIKVGAGERYELPGSMSLGGVTGYTEKDNFTLILKKRGVK